LDHFDESDIDTIGVKGIAKERKATRPPWAPFPWAPFRVICLSWGAHHCAAQKKTRWEEPQS